MFTVWDLGCAPSSRRNKATLTLTVCTCIYVLQARVQQLERAMTRRSGEAAVHPLEQVALQDKQLAAINERLQVGILTCWA